MNDSKKRRITAMMASLVLLGTLFLFISVPNVAHAQTLDPTYNSWSGYNGNNTIYLTTDISSLNPVFINDLSAQANISTNSTTMQSNGLYFSLSNFNSQGTALFEQTSYDSSLSSWTTQIYIPFALSSAGNWISSSVPKDPPLDYSINPIYNHMAVTDNGLPNTHIDILSSSNFGVNVSGPNVQGTNVTSAEENMLIDGFGFIPYFGPLAGVYDISTNWVSLSGVNGYNLGTVGTGTVYENFHLNNTYQSNGAWSALLGEQRGGYDIFGSFMYTLVRVPTADFFSDGNIVVSGAINYQNDGLGNITGANASITLPTRPAYTIQGYINSNGNPAANQEIELASSSGNNYILHTNSNGYYRFFSNPSSTYKLEVPSSSYGAKSVLPADGSTAGAWANLSLNSITFSKTSNVYNEKWSATISGGQTGSQSLSTTGNSITFDVFGNTSYSFSIGDPTGYSASPSTGSINLGSTAYTQSISFSPTVTYSATFSESGLPSGQTWSVKLDGNSKSASAGSSISFTVSDGSHSYSVPYDYYSTTLWYEPTTNGGGTFSINGGGTSIAVIFTGVPQSTTSCVYALAPVLLSNYTTQYAQSIKAGDNIMTYNFSTGSLQQGTVQQVFITHHTEMYVINGYLKVAGDQDIWTNHGYIQAQNLTSNDTIYNVFDNHYYRVHSVSVEYGNFTMYDFYVTANHNYIVWSNLMQDRLP